METYKKIKLLDFKLTKSIGNLLFGVYKSKFYGNGIDFSEHKEYNFGDSIKSIDWKASSKGEKIYKKIFEEEKDMQILFLLDLRESMFFGFKEKTKRDLLEEVFYSIAFSAYKNNDSVGAYLFSEESLDFFPYKKNIGNIFKVIDNIDKIERKNKKNKKINFCLDDILNIIKKRNTKNTLIFILTDDLAIEENKNILKKLSLQNEVIFVSIFDYFENNLEKIDLDITFQDSKNSLNINLRNKQKIKNYSENRTKKLKELKSILQKNGILNIYLDTKKDVFKELFLAFNR